MEKSEQEARGNYAQSMWCLESMKLSDSLLHGNPSMTSTPALRLSHFVANSPIALALARTKTQKWTTAGSAVAMRTRFEVVLKNRDIRIYDKNANRACSQGAKLGLAPPGPVDDSRSTNCKSLG